MTLGGKGLTREDEGAMFFRYVANRSSDQAKSFPRRLTFLILIRNEFLKQKYKKNRLFQCSADYALLY
jgi:hypothetical protein